MNKKIIALICTVAVLAAGIVLLSFAIRNKANEEDLYSSYYTLDEDFIIEASNGCISQKKNTVEFIKTAYNSGANCIELDLTFDPSGVPYIESSPYNINSGSLMLEQVLKLLSDDPIYKNDMLDLKVNSADNMPLVEELCTKYNMTGRVFLSGISVNQASYIKSNCSLPFYVTMDIKYSNDKGYLSDIYSDISNSFAVGLICDADEMSDLLAAILHENWIDISFENINSKHDCIKALKKSPKRIKTNKPYEVLEIVQTWQNEAPIEYYGIETTTDK